MEPKQLFTEEERAVSPVIAVVLMIAVTVILAAIVASFALGMGSSASAAPQASFEYQTSGGSLTITNQGGDPLDAGQVQVLKNGTAVGNSWSSDPITAGSEYGSFSAPHGTTVRIVWTGDNGKSTTLSTFTAP